MKKDIANMKAGINELTTKGIKKTPTQSAKVLINYHIPKVFFRQT